MRDGLGIRMWLLFYLFRIVNYDLSEFDINFKIYLFAVLSINKTSTKPARHCLIFSSTTEACVIEKFRNGQALHLSI